MEVIQTHTAEKVYPLCGVTIAVTVIISAPPGGQPPLPPPPSLLWVSPDSGGLLHCGLNICASSYTEALTPDVTAFGGDEVMKVEPREKD